jgi:hypothetical protein
MPIDIELDALSEAHKILNRAWTQAAPGAPSDFLSDAQRYISGHISQLTAPVFADPEKVTP